jgi:hypothetical protein
MSKKGEEVYYVSITEEKDKEGNPTGEFPETLRTGFFEFWGQQDTYSPSGYVIRDIVGLVRDKITGKVYICPANQITFKNTSPP